MNAVMKGMILVGSASGLGLLAVPSSLHASIPPRGATVTVDNTRGVPVAVFAERGDLDVRLGTVGPVTEAVLALPGYLAEDDDVRLVVTPKVGFDLFSQDITVPRAGTVRVLVPDNNVGYVQPTPDAIPDPGTGTTTLTVRNPRDDDVSIYVEHGEFDTRLGTVRSGEIRTFDLPEALTREPNDVEIFVHPRQGLDLASAFFTLSRGNHLEVKVPRT
jgi:hypothetical protein